MTGRHFGRTLAAQNMLTEILNERQTLARARAVSTAEDKQQAIEEFFTGLFPVRGHWQLNPRRQRVEFKLADMWIGLFWKFSYPKKRAHRLYVTIRLKNGEQIEAQRCHIQQAKRLDLWICLIPTLPLHIILTKRLTGCFEEIPG
jgi:hypothetical protein